LFLSICLLVGLVFSVYFFVLSSFSMISFCIYYYFFNNLVFLFPLLLWHFYFLFNAHFYTFVSIVLLGTLLFNMHFFHTAYVLRQPCLVFFFQCVIVIFFNVHFFLFLYLCFSFQCDLAFVFLLCFFFLTINFYISYFFFNNLGSILHLLLQQHFYFGAFQFCMFLWT
jgi:hypothetical protein